MITIIEALKKLKLIEKKIASNTECIGTYSAQMSNEKPLLGSEEEQRKEIKSLAQANEDLAVEYAKLKVDIEVTNLTTMVSMHSYNWSIHTWLVYSRKLCRLVEETYNAMSDYTATQALRHLKSDSSAVPVCVERYFDEREKQDALRKWMEIYHDIDARLEVVNATTKLKSIADIT